MTARASRYLLSANTYTAWNPPRTRLQVLSGGQWVTVKDLVMTRGAVTDSFTSAPARTYRILTSSSSSVWGAASAGVAS